MLMKKMKKIAIISDIHANLPALNAVLEDIENNYQADEIYCLGDLVDCAPWHNEVIKIIKHKGIPTIMGNHDERIVLNAEVIPMAKHSAEETKARIDAIEFTKASITAENKSFLSTLKKSFTIQCGKYSCMLVHGSPNSNREYIFENHPQEKIAPWFEEHRADIIITGHTHYSYIRTIPTIHGDKQIINAGSVGRTREDIEGKAVYLQLNIDSCGEVTPILRKLDYDIEATIQGIKESPISDFYARFFERCLTQ